jgi:hypothetical protein
MHIYIVLGPKKIPEKGDPKPSGNQHINIPKNPQKKQENCKGTRHLPSYLPSNVPWCKKERKNIPKKHTKKVKSDIQACSCLVNGRPTEKTYAASFPSRNRTWT